MGPLPAWALGGGTTGLGPRPALRPKMNRCGGGGGDEEHHARLGYHGRWQKWSDMLLFIGSEFLFGASPWIDRWIQSMG